MSDFDLPFVKRRWWQAPDLDVMAKMVAVQQLVSLNSEQYLTLLTAQRRLLGSQPPKAFKPCDCTDLEQCGYETPLGAP